ncbi:MAG: hypothetical protein ABJ242_01055 [Marinomonas sp.]
MESFLFCLIAVFLLSLGARDQLMMARMSQASGGAGSLIVIGAVTCIVSAGAMAFAGSGIAALLPEAAQNMLIAFALIAAAFELAWPVKIKEAKEPTHSKGAFGIVLAAAQVRDAARFAVFAFAAGSVLIPAAGLGGALGGIGALYLGFAMGAELETWPLKIIRRALAVLAAAAGLFIALSVRGILG